MKKLVRHTITMLIITMILGVLPTDAEGKIYEDTLRLHILANSDSADDQGLKLKIRDKILEKYGNMLRDGNSISEAKDKVMAVLPQIENDVRKWISDLGYRYNVKAILDEEWYETREYDEFSLPAGKYLSLRIIIGRGEGQNWWCVMYPPLCMEMAAESAPADDGVIDYTNEEIALITSGEYQIKFKILEELSRAFSKNG